MIVNCLIGIGLDLGRPEMEPTPAVAAHYTYIRSEVDGGCLGIASAKLLAAGFRSIGTRKLHFGPQSVARWRPIGGRLSLEVLLLLGMMQVSDQLLRLKFRQYLLTNGTQLTI